MSEVRGQPSALQRPVKSQTPACGAETGPLSPLPGAGLLRREGAAEAGGSQAALLRPGTVCCGPRGPTPLGPRPLPGAFCPAAWSCLLNGLFLRGGGKGQLLDASLYGPQPDRSLPAAVSEDTGPRSSTSSKASLTSNHGLSGLGLFCTCRRREALGCRHSVLPTF